MSSEREVEAEYYRYGWLFMAGAGIGVLIGASDIFTATMLVLSWVSFAVADAISVLTRPLPDRSKEERG